jgi:hypothetical protein
MELVESLTPQPIESFPKKPIKQTPAREPSDIFRDILEDEERLSRPIREEAKRKRNQLLEAGGFFLMSKEEFTRYFISEGFEIHASLKQQNVGDCYLVAAIHAMSCSSHFEMICRSSMKRMIDGSWQVKIPLMSENGQIITITPEEILPQRNKQFFKRGEYNKIIPDLRPRLNPLKGKEGLQVLESAFIKAKFGTVDRLAAYGGKSEQALIKLGGENFREDTVNSAQWNEDKKRWIYPGLKSLNPIEMARLDYFLENFDPEIHIATASTKHKRGISKLTDSFRVNGTTKRLVARHVYSISSVDKNKKTITLANPWDTSKPIYLTFDQFKNGFSSYAATRIDSRQILQNMERLFH